MRVSIILTTWSHPPSVGKDREDYEERVMLHVERGEFARRSIAECTQKAGLEHELIVISNGGPWHDQRIAELVRNLAVPGRLLFNLVNRGVGGSRSLGAYAATGDLLMFLDDDMSYEDGWLDALVRLHDSLEGPRIVSGMSWPLHRVIERHVGYIESNGFVDGCCLLSRELYDECGGYKYPDTTTRAAPFGARLNAMDPPVRRYSVHPDAVHHVYWRRGAWEFERHPLYDPQVHEKLKALDLERDKRAFLEDHCERVRRLVERKA